MNNKPVTQITLGLLYIIKDGLKQVKKIGRKKMIFNERFASEEGLAMEALRIYFTAISWPLFIVGFAIYKSSDCFKKKMDNVFGYWIDKVK